MLTWGILDSISLLSWIILLVAATLAGIANALAGGGTFMIFPALVFAGVDPIMANATSSVITVPGGIASALVYRSGMTVDRRLFWILVTISVVGGVAGSQLLLHTPSDRFAKVVPYLMIGAALVFTFSGSFGASRVRAHRIKFRRCRCTSAHWRFRSTEAISVRGWAC